jgi:uncharacterized protein (TIGR03083 family)
MTQPSVVEFQVMVFRSLGEVCSLLSTDEWALPTDCPGWSVQDNISHIIGTESMLLGRPAPEHDPGEHEWVKNPIGAQNEVGVDYRRPWPPEEVLAEFREVTDERIGVLEAMTEEDLGAESWTPIGPGTVADLLAVRVMDCWVHEQDIRRATRRPGGLDGPVASHAFGRHARALPYVVGKKVGAPDGTTVAFEVEGNPRVVVAVNGGRAAVVDDPAERPTVTLRMNLDTFNRLSCGRGDVDAVAKGVQVEGDEDLGRRVIAQHNFMV